MDDAVRRIAYQDFTRQFSTDGSHPYCVEFREETRWLFGDANRSFQQSVPGGPVNSALMAAETPAVKALDSVHANKGNRTP